MIRLDSALFGTLQGADGLNTAAGNATGPTTATPFGDILNGQAGAGGDLAGLASLLRAGGNLSQAGGKDLPALPLQGQPSDALPTLLQGLAGSRLTQQGLLPDAEVPVEGELLALSELVSVDALLAAEDDLLPAMGDEAAMLADLAANPALLAEGAVVDPELDPELALAADQAALLAAELANTGAENGPVMATAAPIPGLTQEPVVTAQVNTESATLSPVLSADAGRAGGQGQLPGGAQEMPGFADLAPGSNRLGQETVQTVHSENSFDIAELAGTADLSRAKPAQPQALVAMPVQVITESSAATSRAPALPPMEVPPGDPEWGNELAGRVSMLVKSGSGEASLQLNPPELGRLDIRIVTEGDQAKVQFAVQNAEAREAIEQSMPRLREMLEQGGLQLARGDVSDQSQDRQRDSATDTGLGAGPEGDFDDGAERQEMAVPNQWLSDESDGRVDYYV